MLGSDCAWLIRTVTFAFTPKMVVWPLHVPATFAERFSGSVGAAGDESPQPAANRLTIRAKDARDRIRFMTSSSIRLVRSPFRNRLDPLPGAHAFRGAIRLSRGLDRESPHKKAAVPAGRHTGRDWDRSRRGLEAHLRRKEPAPTALAGACP